jgi:glycosyltransferase involved in cell wall biosynthesis
MPYFSVIVTTYNRNNLILNAINSLINQDEQDWECIIIDDGSDISCLEMLQDIIQLDKRFSFIYQENSGVVKAKNIGISLANGLYITFLDSDDIYLPNHLSSRKKLISDNPNIDLVHGGLKVIGDEYLTNKDFPEKKISIYDCVVGGTFFIKNETLKQIGGFENIGYSEDSAFYNKLVEKGFKVYKTEIQTYIYIRLEENSITMQYNLT